MERTALSFGSRSPQDSSDSAPDGGEEPSEDWKAGGRKREHRGRRRKAPCGVASAFSPPRFSLPSSSLKGKEKTWSLCLAPDLPSSGHGTTGAKGDACRKAEGWREGRERQKEGREREMEKDRKREREVERNGEKNRDRERETERDKKRLRERKMEAGKEKHRKKQRQE